MTISMTISGSPAEVIDSMRAFLAAGGSPANVEPANEAAVLGAPTQTAEPAPKTRRKATAAEPQTIEGTVTITGIDITFTREKMKAFAADGHMDQVAEALAAFGVKKVSDIDPDAKAAPSAKLAAFVAKIEELVAAKAA